MSPTPARTREEALERVVAAARAECAKFRFPDEDRPELWAALQALDRLAETEVPFVMVRPECKGLAEPEGEAKEE